MHVVNRFCVVLALSTALDLLLPPCSLQAEDTNTLPMLTPEARDAIEQGLAQFRGNKFDEAEKTFQKVTEMVPNHPMGWINLWTKPRRASVRRSTSILRLLKPG